MNNNITLLSILLIALLLPGQAAAAPGGGDKGQDFFWHECSPPETIRAAIRSGLAETKAEKMVPIINLPASTDIEACKADLLKQQACRLGDIVVVDVGGLMIRRGRCDRDPAGTEAYALSNAAFSRILSYPSRVVSDWKQRMQTLVFWFAFKHTSGSTPVGTAGGCALAWHSSPTYNGRQIFPFKGVGRTYHKGPDKQRYMAYINMWSVQDWEPEEWINTTDVRPLNILAHETQHDVCCFISHMDSSTSPSTVSKKLIGHQGAHWSLYHNTYGQLMYGCNWRDEGNGTFYSITPARGTRPLDRYLWGLIPPTQVPDIFYVDTKSKKCTPKQTTLEGLAKDCPGKNLNDFDLCLDPPYYRTTGGGCGAYNDAMVQSPTGLRATGIKRNVTIQNIIDANGERWPDYKKSYKTNTQLFVMAVNGGNDLKEEYLKTLNKFRRDFNRHFYINSGHMLRNVNTVDGKDDSPFWQWGGATDWDGDAELEGWIALSLTQALTLEGGALKLYLKDQISGMTHAKLRLQSDLYDSFKVVMTVPLPKDGKPKLVKGKFVLKGTAGTKEIVFPVYADGKKHVIAVHPPHKLMKKAECKQGCTAVCRDEKDPQKPEAEEAWETWYNSCTNEVLRRTYKKYACSTELGDSACGPYCTGPKTDPNLGSADLEGWYDSCATQLSATYDTLELVPVNDPLAATLSGPVLVDTIDISTAVVQAKQEKDLSSKRKKDPEKDWDGDGLVNVYDNCPTVNNPMQVDSNLDEEGDACGDYDADGVFNALDNCPTVVNSLQKDEDADDVGDACDPDFDIGCTASRGRGSRPLAVLFITSLLGLLLLAKRRRS